MAKMNESQEELIGQLVHARADYEKFEEDLVQEVADRKWEAKKTIRDLVRTARAAQVPYRRIGIALGTSDHQTLRNYEADIRKDGR